MKNLFSKILVLGLVCTFMTACLERKSKDPNIELTQDMMRDPSIKAQGSDSGLPGKIGNRLPPANTVPMNWTPYPAYKNDEEAKGNPNPLVANKEILAKGERNFAIYCAVCHGPQGRGNGTVAEKMLVKPPSLLSEKIRGWTDGQLNHLSTKGRGMMSGYESQIPDPNDRWAIVLYIRHLQKNLKE